MKTFVISFARYFAICAVAALLTLIALSLGYFLFACLSGIVDLSQDSFLLGLLGVGYIDLLTKEPEEPADSGEGTTYFAVDRLHMEVCEVDVLFKTQDGDTVVRDVETGEDFTVDNVYYDYEDALQELEDLMYSFSGTRTVKEPSDGTVTIVGFLLGCALVAFLLHLLLG